MLPTRTRGHASLTAVYTEDETALVLPIDGERRSRLMEAVGCINRRHGRHTIRPPVIGNNSGWEMEREWLSGRYTTRLGEVLEGV